MTFAERMDRVTEPEDLERLMIQVRRRGSDNWTMAAVKKRVRDDLWPLLEDHFDDDGSILEWVDEDPTPGDAGLRTSILATVRALNTELREARESAAQEHQEQLQARRAEVETEAAAAEPEPATRTPGGPSEDKPAVAAPESDVESSPAAIREAPKPASQKPRKRKRRLVKRPEDLKKRREKPATRQSHSDREKVRPSKAEADTPGPEPDQGEDAPSPSSASREWPRPIESDPVPAAFASHTFQDGWCVDCGISTKGARENGWACEVDDQAPSEHRETSPEATDSVGNHRFEGDWCIRCGLGREQANRFPCND